MTNLLQDMAPGPLDVYRKKASFKWKSLKLHFESEKCVQYQVKVKMYKSRFIVIMK